MTNPAALLAVLTASPEDGRKLLVNPPINVPLTQISKIVAELGCKLIDPTGNSDRLPRIGWEHRL